MRKNTGTLVRLNQKEKETLTKDSEISGKTIPELLRNSYFKEDQIRVLLPHALTLQLLDTLSQIAEQLNYINENFKDIRITQMDDYLADISDQQKMFLQLLGQYCVND